MRSSLSLALSSWLLRELFGKPVPLQCPNATTQLRRRRKEVRSKERHDPLTTVNSLLSKHSSGKAAHTTSHKHPPPPKDPQAARQARESSERQRALALIAQRKGGAVGNGWDDTPSSAAGWAERNERDKDRAGHRFFDAPSEQRHAVGRKYGRSWEA